MFQGGALCLKSVNWRKHELECIRLAADCMQLVGDVDSPALRSHFLRMARVWSERAVRGPSTGTQIKIEPTDVAQTARGFSSTPVPAYC